MSEKTLHIIVKGKVQGVTYRESARNKATGLNLTGTARNLENGDVEIFVSGKEEALREFLDWCYDGPALASVREVESTETTFQQFDDFLVKRR
jgi:acylphosphatase